MNMTWLNKDMSSWTRPNTCRDPFWTTTTDMTYHSQQQPYSTHAFFLLLQINEHDEAHQGRRRYALVLSNLTALVGLPPDLVPHALHRCILTLTPVNASSQNNSVHFTYIIIIRGCMWGAEPVPEHFYLLFKFDKVMPYYYQNRDWCAVQKSSLNTPRWNTQSKMQQ